MKKYWLVFAILILILTTTLIKNSTKNIEDEIFSIKEKIRFLEKELGNVGLEYNYLSSPEILLNIKSKYFQEELVPQKLDKIKTLSKDNDKIIIDDFELNSQ